MQMPLQMPDIRCCRRQIQAEGPTAWNTIQPSFSGCMDEDIVLQLLLPAGLTSDYDVAELLIRRILRHSIRSAHLSHISPYSNYFFKIRRYSCEINYLYQCFFMRF